MTTKTVIGYRIRKQRKAKRPVLSINKLAVLAEVDSGQLSRAERGLSGLSINALQRIANVLHISLGSLLDTDKTDIHHIVNEQQTCDQTDECGRLILELTQAAWRGLNTYPLACSKSEEKLIQHQIRAAIEEGLHRGRVYAEREITLMQKDLKDRR